MSFTGDAWSGLSALYASILEHPFNRELASGRLARERFRHYLLQDACYLAGFSRALSLAAARAPDSRERGIWAHQASEAIEVELALHRDLFKAFGLASIPVESITPSPVCFSYTNHLLVLAWQEPYPVLLWGLLPCFWIYWEVGKAIRAESAPTNPYRAWIETYSGEEYAATVSTIIEVCESAAERADPALRARMREAFERSALLEWMFWDSAWRMEGWPVP
jgi:thiaminase/transcriptional activator TenA